MPPRRQTHVNTRTSQIYRACVQRVILCACHYAPVRSICIQPCILCETMGVPTSRDWHVSTLKKGPRFLTFIHTGLPVSWSTLMTLHRASESQEESNDRKSRKPLFNRVPFRDGFVSLAGARTITPCKLCVTVTMSFARQLQPLPDRSTLPGQENNPWNECSELVT